MKWNKGNKRKMSNPVNERFKRYLRHKYAHINLCHLTFMAIWRPKRVIPQPRAIFLPTQFVCNWAHCLRHCVRCKFCIVAMLIFFVVYVIGCCYIISVKHGAQVKIRSQQKSATHEARHWTSFFSHNLCCISKSLHFPTECNFPNKRPSYLRFNQHYQRDQPQKNNLQSTRQIERYQSVSLQLF